MNLHLELPHPGSYAHRFATGTLNARAFPFPWLSLPTDRKQNPAGSGFLDISCRLLVPLPLNKHACLPVTLLYCNITRAYGEALQGTLHMQLPSGVTESSQSSVKILSGVNPQHKKTPLALPTHGSLCTAPPFHCCKLLTQQVSGMSELI